MTVSKGDDIKLWNREATVVKVLPGTVYVRFAEGAPRKPVERTLIEDPQECVECGTDAAYIVRHNPPSGAYREGFCDKHLDTTGHYTSLDEEVGDA